MNQASLISICMLCYNHEKFVAESIESILSQTYENWELIIVDNASTDSSAKLIDTYVKQDSRITFLPQETNTFVSLGLNIAMKNAKGEYMALLSADDNFAPTKLEEQLGFMQTEALDLSFTWINAIDSHSKTSAPDMQAWFNKPDVRTLTDILRCYFKMINVTNAPTVMLKTSLLQTTLMHDQRLLQTQDMEYWIRLFKQTQKVAILQKKLTNYRVLEDGGNLSSNKSPEKVNRTNFEMIQLWEQLFTLDNTLLSKVFQTEITKDNKYFVIYEHLKTKKIDVWQYAMLMHIYRTLEADCNVTSPLFKLFFEEYGKFSLVSETFLFEKGESIDWLEEQLKNHKKTLQSKEKGIVWLNQELKTKDASITQIEKKMILIEKEIQSKNETIISYKKIFENIDKKILEIEQEKRTLEGKEEGIIWLEQQLENHKRTLEAKEEGIAWLENKITRMEKDLQHKDATIVLYKNLFDTIDKRFLKEETHIYSKYLGYIQKCRNDLQQCVKKIIKKLIRRG